jgi:AcrR family transcriptional regulator
MASRKSPVEPTDEPVEPPWWTPPRPGRRRNPLSRRQIVDAAVRVLDAEGVEALTVRRLGQELNTGSATLYWHVSGKDELAELVYDQVMGAIELPGPDPGRWREQMRDLGMQSYRVLLQHNDLVRLSLGRIPVGPNMLRVMEWSLGLLRSAGMPEQVAAYAGDILGRYIDASVLEVTSKGGPSPDVVSQHFGTLSPTAFPNMTSLRAELFEEGDDARFEFGLDLLLRGLASFLASSAPD